MAYTDYFDDVQKIYIAYYQRPADPEGLIYWATRLDARGGNLNEIIDAFATSQESLDLYGEITSDNIADVVNGIYNALFGRDAEAEGLAFYVDGFNAGTFTPGTIALDILNGAQNEDALAIDNKVTASMLFTETVDPGLDLRDIQATYAGDADADAARLWLTQVTWLPTTVPTQGETTSFIQASIADPGDPIGTTETGVTYYLTKNQDIITATGTNDTVIGIGDAAAGTFTTGDDIKGGATTTLELDLNGAAGLATVTNVGKVDIDLLAPTAVNDALWTGVGAVNLKTVITPGDTLTLTGADVASTYGLSNGNQGNLTVSFRNTSGTADTVKLSLDGTGTSAAARSTINVASGNSVEGVSIATTGTDFVTIDGGTATKTITVTGDGTDDINVLNGAAALTFDASAATGKQTLTFPAGTIGSGDTIKGGTGTTDQVTANSMTTFPAMSGVETLVTTLDGGVGLYDSTNVSGLITMTVNQGTGSGAVDMINTKPEFTTLNINGPTEHTTVNYIADANATLTVNYGAGSSKFDDDFDGIAVDEVQNLTVNFNVGGVAGVALGNGEVDVDRSDTTSLTVVQAGTDDSVSLDVESANSLDTFILRATAANSSITASTVDFTTHPAVQGLQHLEVTASGVSSTAYVNDWGDINWSTKGSGASYDVTDTTDAMSLQDVRITASEEDSSAYWNTYLVTVGHVDSIVIEASEHDAHAILYYTAVVDADGDGNGGIGTLQVVASGASSHAYASTYISVFDGNIDSIQVLASGDNSTASLSSTVSVYRGNIGDVVITASGDDAYASGYWFSVYDGSIGSITLEASGDDSTAFVSGAYVPSGDVGPVSITASGSSSSAYMYYLTVTGDVGPITITASGQSSYASLYYGSPIVGEIDSITILASGEGSSGYFSYLTLTGDLGPVSLTASGDDASVFAAETWYIYGDVQSLTLVASGDGSDVSVSTMYVSGDIGTISITASGSDASATAYVFTTVSGEINVGAITVAATGADSFAYLSLDTGDGNFGTAAISATKPNSSATFDWEGGGFNSISATLGDASAGIQLYVDIDGTAGGTISGSGSGTLDIDLQGKSITALSAGSMTNNVTFDVTAPATATGAMTLTTGSGADRVQGGNGVDTFNLGGGADTFDFSNLAASDALPSSFTDTIAGGFASGADKIEFGGAAGSGTNYSEVLTPAATLAAFITAADTALNGTILYYFGVVGTDGYLAYDANGTGITDIVKLTGIADMAAGDIS